MLNNFRTVTNTAFVVQARQYSAVAAFGENIFARYQAVEAYNYPGTAFVHRRYGEDGEPLSQVALNIQMVLNSYSQAENHFLTGRQHILQQLNQQLNNHAALMPSQARRQLADKAQRALEQPAATVNNHTQMVQALAQTTFAPKKKVDFTLSRVSAFSSYIYAHVYAAFKTVGQQQFTKTYNLQQYSPALTYNQQNTLQTAFEHKQFAQNFSYNSLAQPISQLFVQAISQPQTLLSGKTIKLSLAQFADQHILQPFAQFIIEGGLFNQTTAGAITSNHQLYLQYVQLQQALAENNTWQRQISLLSYLTKQQTVNRPATAVQESLVLSTVSAGQNYQYVQQQHSLISGSNLIWSKLTKSLNLFTHSTVPVFMRSLISSQQLLHTQQHMPHLHLPKPAEMHLYQQQKTFVNPGITDNYQIWRQLLPVFTLTQKAGLILRQITGSKLIKAEELTAAKMQLRNILVPTILETETVATQIAGLKPQIAAANLYFQHQDAVSGLLKQITATRFISQNSYVMWQNIAEQHADMENILRQHISNYNKQTQDISYKKYLGYYGLQQSINRQYISGPHTGLQPVLPENNTFAQLTQYENSPQNIEQQNILHLHNRQQEDNRQRVIKRSSISSHKTRQNIYRLHNFQQYTNKQSSSYVTLKNIIMPNTVQRKEIGKILDSANLLNVKYIHVDEKNFQLPLGANSQRFLEKPRFLAADKPVAAVPPLGLAHSPGLFAEDRELLTESLVTADNIIYLRRESIEDVAAQVLARHKAAGPLSMDANGEYLGEAALEAQTLNSGMYRPQTAAPVFAEPDPHTKQPVEPLVEGVMEELLKGTNMTQLADKVYEAFERRIKYEKRRFGL